MARAIDLPEFHPPPPHPQLLDGPPGSLGEWVVSACDKDIFFSLTKCLLHAGRIVTQSLEKSKAHVLLYPLSQLKYAEDLLLRCEGKDVFHRLFISLCACGRDSNSWKLAEMSVKINP